MFKYLYVHVPFCDNICTFCDFFRVKKSKNEMVEEYLDCLQSEIEKIKSQLNLKTIFLGGGTPSCLCEKQLERLLKILKPYANEIFEYTIEMNPESTSIVKLQLLKRFGVNRLSFGVQCFDDDLLKSVNRHHTVDSAIDVYQNARKLGFDNISFDLIYNLFNQTLCNIDQDLFYLDKLHPDHVSWYSLILKENSILGKKYAMPPDNDYDYDLKVNAGLQALGYERYEISSYALNPAKRSAHNLAYWQNKSFAGVGPGASGYMRMTPNSSFLTHNSKTYRNWSFSKEPLDCEAYYFQIMMMGLRLTDGIDFRMVPDGYDAYVHFKSKIEEQVHKGMLIVDENSLCCTKKGYNFLDDILLALL